MITPRRLIVVVLGSSDRFGEGRRPARTGLVALRPLGGSRPAHGSEAGRSAARTSDEAADRRPDQRRRLPGLNAVLRGVVLAADKLGWEVIGFKDGFEGLLLPEHYIDP